MARVDDVDQSSENLWIWPTIEFLGAGAFCIFAFFLQSGMLGPVLRLGVLDWAQTGFSLLWVIGSAVGLLVYHFVKLLCIC